MDAHLNSVLLPFLDSETKFNYLRFYSFRVLPETLQGLHRIPFAAYSIQIILSDSINLAYPRILSR